MVKIVFYIDSNVDYFDKKETRQYQIQGHTFMNEIEKFAQNQFMKVS